MRLFITGDTNEESGIGEVIGYICGPTLTHFAPRDYGDELSGVCVVLMCRDPSLNFKRRIRRTKKDKMLYMDIMLDLPTMSVATPLERRQEVARRLCAEVPEVLAKYKLKEFYREAFSADLCSWMKEQLGDDLSGVQ